ncbi:putative ubx domain-containing protein [Phaeoacremonium minimum UCRPA7]|uniref:Putative ubx domain-containing protein n=1 Tax=Phaeoacremonium minimum (strain UCR-PA7) TaxID=1286976 RepID=R8BC58_PHAM7|nr:putative ubx domain-containing protein [Phaeoacremonium minimum UCRPA7]EON96880.1 putative ubx domain-containing protein [Phaeoacremonium minimum UCRPA7]
MASHVVVIATDFRRANVKVGPGSYLIDVLEEACKKLNLTSDKYLLKHNKKQIDLTLPFRSAGLPGGAKLELVVKSNTPSAVSVALRLPESEAKRVPNGRLSDKFRSDTTLWKMLRHFENTSAAGGQPLNFTQRGVPQTSNGVQAGSGQLYYECPAIVIMGREISSLPDFQKTLSQLGVNSGSVLMQLAFKKTDKTLDDTMKEIELFFKDADAGVVKKEEPQTVPAASESEAASSVETPAGATTESNAVSDPVDPQEASERSTEPPAPEPMDVDSQVPADPLQPVNVYSAPSGSSTIPIEEPDSVYVPTIAHAQLHQQRLQASGQNKRLLSDRELQERAAAQEAKLAAIKSVDVKGRFPDQTSVEWRFGPDATGATLHKAVRLVMANETAKIKLVLPGGKGYIQDEDGPQHRLIKSYQLEGRVLVNVVWDDSVPQDVKKQPFLKGSVASEAKEYKPPPVPQGEEEEEEKKPAAPVKTESKPSGSGESGGKKLPKWLKLPGKK